MRYTDYNGYLVAGTLKSDNAGFSKWGVAQKDGQDYFLKEFLSPVYPQNASMYSPEQAEKRRKYCEKYEAQKTLLYKTINEASDGNDVRIVDFFRCESHYYIAMPCIPSEKLTPEDVAQMSSAGQAQQRLLCKTLAHSIWKLHKVGIVHGDLKWDNVLLQKSQSGGLTTKIIDFDNSFFEAEPPSDPESFNFDVVYLAPEGYLFAAGEDVKVGKPLDVFALGVLFHQIFQGSVPEFVSGTKYNYLFEGLLSGDELKLGDAIPADMAGLIAGMLETDPVRRYSLDTVVRLLSGEDIRPEQQAENREATQNDREAALRINIYKSTKGAEKFKQAGSLF